MSLPADNLFLEHCVPNGTDSLLITPPSIQSLYIEMLLESGESIASGTCFITKVNDRNYLITNYHNVAGINPRSGKYMHSQGAIPNKLRVHFLQSKKFTMRAPKEIPLFDGSNKLWFTHPKHNESVDIAVLPIRIDESLVDIHPYGLSGISGHGAAELPCRPRLSAGQELFIPGFPFGKDAGGKFAIWIRGSLASETFVDYDGLPLFLIDARTRMGQSGSPVIMYHAGGFTLLEDGRSFMIHNSFTWLLGIYSGRMSEESDIGFVWKASAILEIINSIPS